MRDMARRHSNWRSDNDLDSMLKTQKLPGIAGLDTRRLTRLLRDSGSLRGAFGTADQASLLAAARSEQGTSGVDLVSQVTTPKPYTVGDGKFAVVAYDFGIKTTILRCLSEIATVTVVPAHTTAEEVLALAPNGVFLSNGPGDPEPCDYAIAAIAEFLKTDIPVFGICLGHQLLALASGAQTLKMKFGHHGANHPVKDLDSGRVSITSQNHGFAVDEKSLPANLRATHISLFDNTLQGLARTDKPAFCFQGHPEASPGPHDIGYLFDRFIREMETRA